MTVEDYKMDVNALLAQAQMSLSAEDYESFIEWLKNESGWM